VCGGCTVHCGCILLSGEPDRICLNQHIYMRSSSKEHASGLSRRNRLSCAATCLPERTGQFLLSTQMWLVTTHSCKTQPQLSVNSQGNSCSHGNHFGRISFLSHSVLLLCHDNWVTNFVHQQLTSREFQGLARTLV